VKMAGRTWREGYVPGKAKKTIHLDDEVARALEIRAAQERVSQAEIVERALRKELGLMETLIDVIVTGDTWTELAETIKVHLAGETEAEQIAEAMRIVAERGYKVIRDEDGGHNTITSDASGRRAIAITVEPS